MEISTVSTTGSNTLLPAVRSLLGEADEALLCVAFANEPGVNLIRPQLRELGSRARLLVTSTFATTRPSALATAHGLGVEVRVLNPSGGTFHPKVILADSPTTGSGMLVGSANLTGGLVHNVEIGALIHGRRDDRPIADAWEIAEGLWDDDRVVLWDAEAPITPDEFEPALYEALVAAVEQNSEFWTLGSSPKRNVVTEVTRSGLYVETAASKAKGRSPQLIPSWMLQVAWEYLRAKGELSAQYLLADDGLNVKRSSGVCAILSRLPGVGVRAGRRIVLEWNSKVSS